MQLLSKSARNEKHNFHSNATCVAETLSDIIDEVDLICYARNFMKQESMKFRSETHRHSKNDILTVIDKFAIKQSTHKH